MAIVYRVSNQRPFQDQQSWPWGVDYDDALELGMVLDGVSCCETPEDLLWYWTERLGHKSFLANFLGTGTVPGFKVWVLRASNVRRADVFTRGDSYCWPEAEVLVLEPKDFLRAVYEGRLEALIEAAQPGATPCPTGWAPPVACPAE